MPQRDDMTPLGSVAFGEDGGLSSYLCTSFFHHRAHTLLRGSSAYNIVDPILQV